ncbi:MAG TPA: polyphenol oxidase family protein [Thermoanaerobaculia bacterium]|nr:polyphenol oxidase family protein [Thermoanaerobaculia bacterium]
MFAIEQSDVGRIVVPRTIPSGKALFYTTLDFDGHLDGEIVRVLAQRFGIDATLATCNQVHGTTVECVGRGSPVAGRRGLSALRPLRPATRDLRPNGECDALWTEQHHVALGIKIADCLPVTLIDGDAIANIHSGWRGAVQRITAITLDTITRGSSFDPKSAYAYLGPSIRVCCFEVGEEVAVRFPSTFVDRTHAKPHVDIAALTVDLLRQRGFASDRIFDSGLCTRCDGSIFHSFRRDGPRGGRNLAIVAQ